MLRSFMIHDKTIKCTNCGLGHKSNFRKCQEYIINSRIKKIMAVKNVSAYETRRLILDNRG